MRYLTLCLTFVASATVAAAPAGAQIVHSRESLEGLYHGPTYSPYAQRAFPSQLLWGDTHVHTALSLDAGMGGNTLGPDEAYRFAKPATGIEPVRDLAARLCSRHQNGWDGRAECWTGGTWRSIGRRS